MKRRSSSVHGSGETRAAACAVVTVSDTRRGEQDRSGATIERLLEDAGHAVVTRGWTPDDPAAIRRVVRVALERRDVDVVITTGGTGIAPRDRTPEALAPLVEAWLPGFGELFRALSYREVGGAAWLSRAAAGIARRRLLVMLPGSVAAVELALKRLILPELGHVIRLVERKD